MELLRYGVIEICYVSASFRGTRLTANSANYVKFSTYLTRMVPATHTSVPIYIMRLIKLPTIHWKRVQPSSVRGSDFNISASVRAGQIGLTTGVALAMLLHWSSMSIKSDCLYPISLDTVQNSLKTTNCNDCPSSSVRNIRFKCPLSELISEVF